MSIRTIEAPGIEVHEIDRSSYDRTTDYSLPNAPTCLITGFANKGENYKTAWINSKHTFVEKYGYPTNNAEQYFYNAAMEILNHGGVLLTHKLPYDNESKDMFSYVEYNFSRSTPILTGMGSLDITGVYDTIKSIKNTLEELLTQLNIEYSDHDINTVGKIVAMCYNLENRYGIQPTEINKIKDIVTSIENLINSIKDGSTLYSDILISDQTLTSYIEISSCINNGKLMSMDEYDEYLTYSKSPSKNDVNTSGKMRIVNIANNKYDKTSWNSIKTQKGHTEYQTNDCLGIVPIIVSPANALYYQRLLNNTNIIDSEYNILSGMLARNISSELNTYDDANNRINIDQTQLINELTSSTYMIKPFASTVSIYDDTQYDDSWTKEFSQYFPSIAYNSDNTFDVTHLKKIGIIVVKAFQDTANNNTLNFQILESFVGSLDKNAKNQISHKTEFIDNIVNSSSQYINVFTNIDQSELDKACFIGIHNQIVPSLGFYEYESSATISYERSIIRPLNRLFNTLNNPATLNIDLIVDAGITNIAQYLIDGENKSFSYLNSSSILTARPTRWFSVAKMFDDFCKNVRKDCMFILDCPRTLCLTGDQKIVRFSNSTNTIENTITRNLRYITGINSSYSTGYCDWFYSIDEYTGDYFWCPPSIKAAGVYCYTDVYFHSWDAPAGMIRGKVTNVYDIAFSPTNTEAGKIYTQGWNYAVYYPLDGIILEGQKTFQLNQTALDRVNVRRLLLYLEKQTSRIGKMFLWEGNTAYLRQKFVDTLSTVFENVKNGNGILEYIIKCDETNNTPAVINRNELHVSIAIKPVKTVEYLNVNFIVTNQSASLTEEIKRI